MNEVISIAAFVTLAILGLVLVRRSIPLDQLVEHHEVAGVCFAVVGGLYGIILAFVLVSSWERYESARAQTEFEASAAADLFRHAEGFDEPTRTQLGDAIVAYVHSMIDDEWPAMVDGHTCPVTQQRYLKVWRCVTELRPTQGWEVALYQSTLQELDTFADGRRHRVFYMESGLPDVIWIFLIAFGVATVSFTYLFGMPRLCRRS